MFNIPLPHNHHPGLVVLSIIIAILASYTALDLAGRVTAAQKRARLGWLVGGATAMGIGIWSMHFTAMLAFRLPIPILYDVPIVILSLLVAIIASGIALFVTSRNRLTKIQLLLGGIVMGLAIAAMHYIGMAAMRLQASLTYNSIFFALSIVIAVVASLAALWLAFEFRGAPSNRWNWLKLSSAVVMGGAISGMHYTGMHAAIFLPLEGYNGAITFSIDITQLGTAAIVVATFLALGLALLLSIIDQRLAQQATALVKSKQQYNAELQKLNDDLKARVAGLQLVTKVGQATTSILDSRQLMPEVVNQIQATFNYYHVHLYLFDASGKELEMVAGTGGAGQEMLAKGHKIPIGKGLVGRAAQINQEVLASNVSQHPDWLPNPLLPDTKAEAAVPISIENQVLGVLDVQQNSVDGLTRFDVDLLKLVASQVAIAIRNARLFAQVENALAKARAAQDQYLRRSWQGNIRQSGQYHFARPNAAEVDEAALRRAKQLALAQNKPNIVEINNIDVGDSSDSKTQSIIAPITYRDKKIGVLQLHPANTGHTWAEDDLAIVEAVVDQLAQSAESLRLFEETRQLAAIEQLIGEISQKLRRAPTLDALVKTASEELNKALNVSHSLVKIGQVIPNANSKTNLEIIKLSHNGQN